MNRAFPARASPAPVTNRKRVICAHHFRLL